MRAPTDPAYADLTDETLYHQVRAGDVRAFDVLYGRYEGRLFGFLMRMVRNHHDAEDLLHEAFINVLRSREVAFDRACFCTWLYRIARNLSLNHIRSAKRKSKLQNSIDAPLAAPRAEAVLEEHERAVLLGHEVTTLPGQLTEMYRLRSSGLSYEEMAEVLSIPLGTVKSRMNQLTVRLRAQLQARLDEDGTDGNNARSGAAADVSEEDGQKEQRVHGLRGN